MRRINLLKINFIFTVFYLSMKIFLSCQQSLKKHNIPGYSFWETYFKNGIEESGHSWLETTEIDWAEGLVYSKEKDIKEWNQRTWAKVVDFVKQQHRIQTIHLFLSYLFPNQIDESAIEEIRSLGIPCVNFFCDNVREFSSIPKVFRCFDLHWVPEFKALKMYQKENLNYVYAPMPVWVSPKMRTCDHPEHYGISFIGSRDIQRERLIADAIALRINLEIRGASWHKDTNKRLKEGKKNHLTTIFNQWSFLSEYGFQPWLRKLHSNSLPKVNEEIFSPFVMARPNAKEYVEIIQRSQITLGINRYPSFRYPFYQPDTYSRARDIEAPMMGACYLTEWTEGIEDLYDLDKEVATYRSPEEMKEKVDVLQSDIHRRQQMRSCAQKRALSEHTFAKSLQKITTSLSIS